MSATHGYVAKRNGEPGAYAACVDDPEFSKETAKFVAGVFKDGGYIERVLLGETAALLNEWVRWKRTKSAQGADQKKATG